MVEKVPQEALATGEPSVASFEDARSPLRKRCIRAAREAGVLAAVGVVLATAVNLLRPNPLPWVAEVPYTVLVPCPEHVAEATSLAAGDPLVMDERSLRIDARTKRDFDAWHLHGAMFAEFDWLGPPVDDEVERIARRVAESGAHRVVVYGDGEDPDTGKEWARLMAGAKLKNVFYVRGGAPALREARQGGQR